MLDKTYQPLEIEAKWTKFWQSSGYYKAGLHQGGGQDAKNYCIMLPPPNVTGSLHMGHAFQDTLMDVLIRYHRMSGYDTHWQLGCDHAGIATQMVVERRLNKQGKSKHDLGREAFLDEVWRWKAESGGTIFNQMSRLGTSGDMDASRFTMDEGLSAAVLEVFIRLYDEGLIYRGKRLVNWDPVLLTAVSDLEVINEDATGKLWHIRYPLVDDASQFITVATTRPETMFGDVAVAVHPEDVRYKHLIGKMLKLPLSNRNIPIIADDYVKPEFGTGCVKITPAHDFNDHEIGKRHQLEMINIFTKEAKLNEVAPFEFRGLDRFDAREKALVALTDLGLLEKTEEHALKIPKGDRTGAVIEPYLTDQWFIKVESLAKPAIEAVESGQIKFVPENWSKTYFEWMNNLQDWCISRQLWWGHRIPAWYDKDGKVYVGHDEESVRAKYKLSADITLNQDNDVLDTWFSSALWPFSTLGWPEKTPQLDKYYPTQVLVTGFDIIFFWVARMIMMGLKFTGKVPFETVYVHGLIQDHEGQKMSKSKGNVIDPIDLIDGIDLESLVKKRVEGLMQPQMKESIEKNTRKVFPDGIPSFGTDAVRFCYCAIATHGRHIRFELNRVDSYSKFCNKIFNAARYVLMNMPQGETYPKVANVYDLPLSVADKWIWSRVQRLVNGIHHYIENYRFDLAAQSIYEFTWNEFCDWYLELSKPILQGQETSEEQKRATRYTLVHVLETLMRIIHPLMPFISEELWQTLKNFIDTNMPKSIMICEYPTQVGIIDEACEAQVVWLQNVVLGVRNIRGENNIPPGKLLPLILKGTDKTDKEHLGLLEELFKSLARIESITWSEESPSLCATALVGNLELLIPMANLIDKKAETERLERELTKSQVEFDKCHIKLSNENYVQKAPAAVVEKEKERLEELSKAIVKIKQKIADLNSL